MKLLYITNQFCGSGGLERVLSVKAGHLAEMGYEVHISSLNQGDLPLFYEFSNKLIYHDITANGNKLKSFREYIKGLKKVVNKVKPDIILVCDDGLKGFLVPFFVNKPCPMIYERHVSKNIEVQKDKSSFIDKIKLKITSAIMNFGAKKYDKFVVLTKGNLAEWNLKNLAVISNPLSFYTSERSSLKNKKVIAVGKQSFQKGYDRLLKSWSQVIKKHPEWNLEIYGKIDASQGLIEQAEALGIQKNVHFFPPTKNIKEKYKEASIYVLSSRYEGFGMVLIEAMAYGVPCISFDCPCGPSDIISDNIDGILVPNGNTEMLADKINFLIENENTRMKMGKQAKENVKRFLPENILKQWDDLFKSLTKS